MSNYGREPNRDRETSADRIRRRMQDMENSRYKYRPRINPFTVFSMIIILLVGMFVMANR